MQLSLEKLEELRHVGQCEYQARCPACAEEGGDRKAEHLRVFANGKFGCCANPKDKDHRQRITELAGLQRSGLSIRPFPVSTTSLGRSIKTEVMRGYGTAGTPESDPEQPRPAHNAKKAGTLQDMISAVPAVPKESATPAVAT